MELYARSEHATGRPQRAIERFTQAVGRPRALFALLAVMAGWMAFHSLKRSFDPPPFFRLQGLRSEVTDHVAHEGAGDESLP